MIIIKCLLLCFIFNLVFNENVKAYHFIKSNYHSLHHRKVQLHKHPITTVLRVKHTWPSYLYPHSAVPYQANRRSSRQRNRNNQIIGWGGGSFKHTLNYNYHHNHSNHDHQDNHMKRPIESKQKVTTFKIMF